METVRRVASIKAVILPEGSRDDIFYVMQLSWEKNDAGVNDSEDGRLA